MRIDCSCADEDTGKNMYTFHASVVIVQTPSLQTIILCVQSVFRKLLHKTAKVKYLISLGIG